MRIIMVLAFLFCVSGIGAWLYLDHWLNTPRQLDAAVTVDLPLGLGTMDIGQALQAAGVIDQPWLFFAAVKLGREQRALRAGEYQFKPGQTPAEVIEAMRTGAVLLHPVTVPEGRTVKEAYAILAGYDFLSGDLPPLPPEGTLLPETYLVARGTTRAQLVKRMASDMQRLLDSVWNSRPAGYPLAAPLQLLTLASIIERETAKADEYPLVAAVFLNRLQRGMRLQTDPTVIYGLADGMGSIGRPLTRADLASDTPFNTYKIDGLPPGPIANPGKKALMAAVRPAAVDYVYFVADGSGGHVFASTLQEHNRNVANWRKIESAKDALQQGGQVPAAPTDAQPPPAGPPPTDAQPPPAGPPPAEMQQSQPSE
ncbi:endolytic transglycosylase MltG [Arboricoccus pini]|uniref:endolytic transglycosylase MltG n=1 Tax=Arboricoccus pini TaxID=1963835 RepID=UPI001FAF44DB|nr:endolytic transglycosylase MltG [Arboricoccus pini]